MSKTTIVQSKEETAKKNDQTNAHRPVCRGRVQAAVVGQEMREEEGRSRERIADVHSA